MIYISVPLPAIIATVVLGGLFAYLQASKHERVAQALKDLISTSVETASHSISLMTDNLELMGKNVELMYRISIIRAALDTLASMKVHNIKLCEFIDLPEGANLTCTDHDCMKCLVTKIAEKVGVQK